ncbi:bifunctional glutamate N-acetyltransferase/amino-acid acetyltransferase ArgJ [bacterium]|nr:bifunctional glutamate N-acetyltransferase/amino-acid acetyltransferase ArgJ [bacterium]
MHKNITNVKGFSCWGAHIGIKSKRRDLAMIYSEVPATAAAVFTRNVIVAEPVKLTRQHVANGKAQAIIINSGNANACTGKQGWDGAVAMAEAAAKALDLPVEDVLIASTGIIGETFPTAKVTAGIEKNVLKLSKKSIASTLAANAILTTDTFAKEGFTSFKIGKHAVNMAGIAKGSGMIHPNMGTMLAFIVSDIAISASLLDEMLKEITEDTFNMITVDGDTSTNDMVAVLCNGLSGNSEITDKENEAYKKFRSELQKMCLHLAKLIVSDGEGSTKFVEYKVVNAPTQEDARRIVRTVSDSSLVKTAIFGRDPNWGRIIAAAGRAGVPFDPDKLDLYIGTSSDVKILEHGQPTDYSRTSVKKKMRAAFIRILIDLNQGEAEATGWGSDFSYEYVRINAEYTT